MTGRKTACDRNAREWALAVEVFEGEIVVRDEHGPAAVALTPAAAEETAKRLAEAVRAADDDQLSQTDDTRL